MIDPALFHFLRPQWFIAVLPLALLTWFLFFRKGAKSNWAAAVDERLLPHLLVTGATRTRRTTLLLVVTGGLLGIVALAGPVWEQLPRPVFTTQDALVIALDLTRSMDANDVSPSRLERARYKISDILEQRQEGQTALLVYGGAAFTVTPLTDDAATIRSQLQALDTDIMPAAGNRTDRALTLALDLLQQGGAEHGHVLLITDDVSLALAADGAARLRGEGYRLSVLGAGTRHGAPVLLPDGSFLQGRDGEIIIPVLNEGELRQLALAGGGLYVRLGKDDQDVRQLLGFFAEARPEGEQAGADVTADVWREQGPWLVLGLLPLAALLFRRGYVLGLALLLPLAEPAQALDWESLWWRADQRAQRAMAEQDYTGAAKLFADPAWRGAAQHRAGDYQGAIDSLEPLDNVQSSYNRGNALARMGRYQEAIAAYQRALAEQPDHADAKFNKALLEQALAGQQEQEREAADGGEQQTGSQDQEDAPAPPEEGEQGEGQQATREQGQEDVPAPAEAADQEEEGDQDREDPFAGEEEEARQDNMPPAQAEDSWLTAEEQQATEQWLRRIPDDPSGLLRRKFRYQYQRREYDENRVDQSSQ